MEDQRHLVDRLDVLRVMTASSSTSQKRAIFDLMPAAVAIGAAEQDVGWMPIARSSLTECCVALVFSSEAACMYGTRVRCT